MPRTYDIGEHLERFIDSQVETGHYADASEVVRAALRLLEARELARVAELNDVRAAIHKGLNSGPGRPAEQVFERLRRKYGTIG
ncbi:MAG: hypothetical protein ABS36_11645 [Acidobacteria bacterium SCN 69-37]|nr:MAG: hypothetical protein ABS36_11645 [Acidobacteria bacterium SCN 69-37]